MEQLSAADAAYLEFESDTTLGHTSTLVVLDTTTGDEPFSFDLMRERLAERIHMLPPFRRKLFEVPFKLDRPYWIEDPLFDLDYHLRHIAVPPPAGRKQLANLVARIHERPLDRRRPLWEMYLIEGVADDRVAVLTKLHHASVEGLGGLDLLTALTDLAPDQEFGDVVDDWYPDHAVPMAKVMANAAWRMATSPARMFAFAAAATQKIPAARSVLAPTAFLLSPSTGTSDLLAQPDVNAPRTVFNRAVGPHRRWAFASVPLADVKAVKDKHGVTVNDVILALVGGVVRHWLFVNDQLPERPLSALVPLGIGSDDDEEFGGRVAGMVTTLATHRHNEVERLLEIAEGMREARDEYQAVPADVLRDMSNASPPIAALAARLVARTGLTERFNPLFNIVVTNVPGPSEPLYAAGARIDARFLLGSIIDGVGLNITVGSHEDVIDIGFTADRDLVPDLWTLADQIEVELKHLR